MQVSQNPDGTYAFQLTVRDNQNQSRNYYVPLDRGEFYVMQKIADRAIPNLLGLMP